MNSIIAKVLSVSLMGIEQIMLFILANSFFEKKRSTFMTVASLIIVTLIIFPIVDALGNMSFIKFFIALILLVFWMNYCYRAKTVSYLFTVLFFLGYLMLADGVFLSSSGILIHESLQKIVETPYAYFLLSFSAKTAELLIVLLISVWARQHFHKQWSSWINWIRTLFLPASFLVVSIFLPRMYGIAPELGQELLLCSAVLLLGDIASIFLLNYLEDQQVAIQDNAILRQNMKIQLDNIEAWREAYALDIGGKIKAQQRQAMKDGKFVGARAPYGYKKAQNDCHQLVVDPDAAQVVRQMFQWASEGAGLNTIARRLNEAGCQTPSHYKRDSGIITHDKLVGNGDWQTRTVAKILHSPIYTGDLVQGCTKTVDHRQVQANQNDRIVVHGTHEAIVSHEQYEAVQVLLAETARSSREKKIDAYSANPLKGKVFCGCCGGHLHRRRNSRKTTADVYVYYCLTKSRVNRSACPGVLIFEEKLLSMLLDVLLEAMEAVLGQYALLLEDNSALDLKKAGLKDELTRCNSDLKRSRDIVGGLYENLVKGIISNSEYLEMRSTYGAKVARLEVEKQRLEKELRTLEMQATNYSRLARDAAEVKANRKLTAELLDRLVERVDIWPDKHIQVKFLFESEFAQCSGVLKP